jgi:hypothetical protein
MYMNTHVCTERDRERRRDGEKVSDSEESERMSSTEKREKKPEFRQAKPVTGTMRPTD